MRRFGMLWPVGHPVVYLTNCVRNSWVAPHCVRARAARGLAKTFGSDSRLNSQNFRFRLVLGLAKNFGLAYHYHSSCMSSLVSTGWWLLMINIYFQLFQTFPDFTSLQSEFRLSSSNNFAEEISAGWLLVRACLFHHARIKFSWKREAVT